nr:SubclassB3_beta_lactamase [uncultured bacterium]
MKTTVLARLTCSLTFLSLATILPAQSPSPSASETPSAMVKSWLAPAEPLHIAGPINFVGTQGLGVYLITTPAGHILLGGGMPGSAATIETSIRKLGYKPEDIKILLSNHAHFDHVGTLADLKKLTRATVAAMDRDVDLLASAGKIDYLFAKNPRFRFPPVTVDRVLKEGDVVELGNVKLTARLTAGHTPGCATFTTTLEERGRSYNVVFPDGTSVNEGTRFLNNPSYPGILEDYRRTFTTLESLKPDIFLTYHVDEFDLAAKRTRAATEGVRAFVDPEGYKRFIAERKAKFEKLVTEEKSSTANESLPTPAQ